jgi:hypothetical protein
VNVPDESQQVDIRIDQQCVIALLEQVSQLTGTPVYAPGVLAAQPLHESADWHIRYLQDQMDRVCFPAECVRAHAASDQHRREQPLERRVIGFLGENWLTSVTTLNDVINAARYVQSGSA